jgi:hypothetical protein
VGSEGGDQLIKSVSNVRVSLHLGLVSSTSDMCSCSCISNCSVVSRLLKKNPVQRIQR